MGVEWSDRKKWTLGIMAAVIISTLTIVGSRTYTFFTTQNVRGSWLHRDVCWHLQQSGKDVHGGLYFRNAPGVLGGEINGKINGDYLNFDFSNNTRKGAGVLKIHESELIGEWKHTDGGGGQVTNWTWMRIAKGLFSAPNECAGNPWSKKTKLSE